MKSGSINEKNVFDTIKEQDWCYHLCEVGCLQMTDFRGAVVSPDGVGMVFLPNRNEEEDDPVIASIEIKTRFDKLKLAKLWDIQQTQGTNYIQCKVGDSTWWKVVPPENRAQVVHQAMVTGLDHVLFVSADKGGIILACIVDVTADQKAIFKKALQKFKPLMDWFHDSIESNDKPPEPHKAFKSKYKYLCETHTRVSQAFHKLI